MSQPDLVAAEMLLQGTKIISVVITVRDEQWGCLVIQ